MLSNFLYKYFAGLPLYIFVFEPFQHFWWYSSQTLVRSMRGNLERRCRERVAGKGQKEKIEGRSKIGKKDGKKIENREKTR